MTDADRRWMERALALAARAGRAAQPNPLVGAVLVRDGRRLGEGWHRGPGLPHAEREALADARAAGEDPAGATLYVTLEPCHCHGRTPPCTEAILEAGVARVVYALEDPNPVERGRSHRLLAEAGLDVAAGLLAGEAAALNAVYVHNQTEGRPHVVLKCAATLNGMLARADGSSRWISGPESRREAHRLRAEATAVAVGAETARMDRPRLDLRNWEAGGLLPRPVVFDTDPPRCPADLDWEGREPLLLVPEGAEVRAAEHAARGWRVLPLPADAEGRVLLEIALPTLLGEGLSSLLVEGGGRLLSAFLRSGLWERWELVLAPTLFADDGRPFWSGAVELGGLRVAGVARRGDDVQLTLLPAAGGAPDAAAGEA